jgi:transcriptional regulator with XRE-family HTH domain
MSGSSPREPGGQICPEVSSISWTVGGNFGNRIQRARKKRGWSQEDFAYRANIDRSYVGGLRLGSGIFRSRSLCAIAQTLGCDLASLTYFLTVATLFGFVDSIEI